MCPEFYRRFNGIVHPAMLVLYPAQSILLVNAP
jgi:hypothetical protein